MVELGIEFEEFWASKASVVTLVNRLCKSTLAQAEIWEALYNNRKGLPEEYNFLFPNSPHLQRKRTSCHLYEAWYVIALMCSKHKCLHLWLTHFNLGDAYDLIKAKEIVFNGVVIVNGIHIEGQGVIKL
jgi:hypothetical protein